MGIRGPGYRVGLLFEILNLDSCRSRTFYGCVSRPPPYFWIQLPELVAGSQNVPTDCILLAFVCIWRTQDFCSLLTVKPANQKVEGDVLSSSS
jgi:hypothetical protein